MSRVSIEKRPYGNGKMAEVVIHPGAVSILPLHEGKVYLVEQWRAAAGQTLLEIPAGTLEEGEEPLACAHRELQEEIGYAAKTMAPSLIYYPSPGFCNQKLYHFRAHDLYPSKLEAEDSDEITVVTLSLADAFDAIHQGKIIDAKTIIALYSEINA